MLPSSVVFLPQKFPDDRTSRRHCSDEMGDIVCALSLTHARQAATARMKTICSELGLAEQLKCRLCDVSCGERRRLELIARMIGVEMRGDMDGVSETLLLIDGPTSGLDVRTEHDYVEQLLNHDLMKIGRSSMTIIMSTHSQQVLNNAHLVDSVIQVGKKTDTDRMATHCAVKFCRSLEAFKASTGFAEVFRTPQPQEGVL